MSLFESDEVRPLLARVAPIPGESLLSLMSRACEANVIERPNELTAPLGISRRSAFLPFTAAERAEDLARVLGADVAEVTQRMHGSVPGAADPTYVHWFGTTMERRFLAAEGRRFAPEALQMSAHHRAAWSLTPLSFCPETFQTLLTQCTYCEKPTGWSRNYGLARCDHCRSFLSEQEAPFVPEAQRRELTSVTDLISHEEAVRARALVRYPLPFREWGGGEVFCAIVEFGVAALHPHADRRGGIGHALIWGKPELASPELLIAGRAVTMGWPGSLAELIGRFAEALGLSASDRRQLRTRELGLLGRHLDGRLPATRFRQLLRDSYTQGAIAAEAPIRIRRAGSMRGALITLGQAEVLTGISRRRLSRLVPDGDSCAGGIRGRGGALRFHADRLGQAARAFDDALPPSTAAAVLGVPEYCLHAFVKRKLISLVEDPDILLMKRAPFAVSKASIDALTAKFGCVRDDPCAYGERLDLSLAHRFSPAVWAGVFVGLLKGRSGYTHMEEARYGWGLTRRIFADQELVGACAAGVKRPRLPRGVAVTAQTAALLLGVSMSPLLSLIEEGWLKAERGEGAWQIRLSTLVEFDRTYVLASELAHRTHGSSRIRHSFSSEPEAVFHTRWIRAWERSEGERWHGLLDD